MRVPCVFSTLWTIFSTPFARIWTSAVASCLWSNWMIGTVEKWAQIKANKQCYLFYKPLDEARVCHGCTSRQARPASDFTLPKLQESAGSASEFLFAWQHPILRLRHPSQDLRLCDSPLSISCQADLAGDTRHVRGPSFQYICSFHFVSTAAKYKS